MNGQLEAIIEAETDIAGQIEGLLGKKKGELNQSLQLLYRKSNYELFVQKEKEIEESLEKKRAKLKDLKANLEELEKGKEEKKTAFAVQKLQQRMRLEATKKQMEEIQKVVKVHLRALEKQISEYSSQIINDKKKVGVLNEKYISMRHAKESIVAKCSVFSPQETFTMTKQPPEKQEVQAVNPEPIILVKEQQPEKESDKHSVLANASESGFVPKYGIVNINLADKTESEAEKPDNAMFSFVEESQSKYKIDTDACSVKEVQLFEVSKYILEGTVLYKKYASQHSLKDKVFDPLLSQKYPPESCGYGKRLFAYNPDSSRFEFRIVKKFGVADSSIHLSDVKRVVVPNETKLMIKAQKGIGAISINESMSMEMSKEKEEMKKPETKLAKNEENESFREQCLAAHFYPFSILAKENRIELIADSYASFTYTIQAINEIIGNVPLMKSLCKRLIAIPHAKEESTVIPA